MPVAVELGGAPLVPGTLRGAANLVGQDRVHESLQELPHQVG